MSQWEAILKLAGAFQEQAFAVYSQEVLPVVVRQYLAQWIESQDWRVAARDPSLAFVLFQNLLEHLDLQYSRFMESHELVEANSIRNFKLKVQSLYQENPQQLAERIWELLQKEKQVLLDFQHAQNGQQVQLPMETVHQNKTEQRVNEAKERVANIDQEVKFLEEQQEIFDFRYKNYKLQAASRPTDPAVVIRSQELQVQLNELDKKRKEILDQVKQLLGLCETLLGFLQQELSDWLQRQRLSCTGAQTNTCLKELEIWVTKTVEVFFQLRRILRILSELSAQVSYEGDPLKIDPPKLQERLLEMLHCLLQRSFVVHKQPIMVPCKKPLVLKTSSQFSLGARFLVNSKEITHNMKVSYSMDKNPPDIKGYRRFNLLGTQDKDLENMQKDGMAVEFKLLKLTEKRAGGGGKGGKGANDCSLSVTEELHIITLETQFKHEGVKITLEATTLPFVVISNLTSQFVPALASVLWFSLFSPNPMDVTFFSRPPAAPWSLIASALSWQFSCCTKRGLNTDQLQMLGKKLCGSVPNEESVVMWSKFSKESMPNVSFTFWEWFDAIVSLVKMHLENIWNDGYVMGFVSRRTEEALLKDKQQGTFLLRFSESMRDGGITCSWVDQQIDGTSVVQSVRPFTKKELSIIPMTEIVRNYQLLTEENIPENPLKYLYPDIPKDEAFGQYYEQRSEATLEYQRYMTRRLVMVSERTVDDALSSIASGTPQYSPEPSQYGNEMFLPDLELSIDQMALEGALINPGSDPMLPDQVPFTNELNSGILY